MLFLGECVVKFPSATHKGKLSGETGTSKVGLFGRTRDASSRMSN